MTSTRLLTLAAVSACLILAAPAAASDSGGAIADPVASEASGGGILAPSEAGSDVTAEAARVGAPEAAQDDTPTTPEGEEQPPDQQPNGEQPTTEENGEQPGTEEDGTGGDTGGQPVLEGSLPRTGFEIAALSAIGLGLLLAGGALWPTSSWPPPRNRLSRSTQRR